MTLYHDVDSSPRKPAGWAVASAWIVMLAFWAFVGLAVVHPQPMPAVGFLPRADSAIEIRSALDDRTLAVYHDKDLRLEIARDAPASLLVCMGGKCRLVEEWLEK